MKSALDEVRAELKICDCIIYMLDARCPKSCVNPKYEEFVARKPVLFVLNKADLAKTSFREVKGWDIRGDGAVELDSTRTGAGQRVVKAVNEILKSKIQAASAKGIKKTVRAVVIGVTNCGKSTFINNLAAGRKTQAANRPGVTRTKQWVPVTDFLWLLDTPGTLWPKFDNPQVAKNLAYIGSIKDDILDIVAVAKDLLVDLKKLAPACIKNRFDAETFEDICKKRGYILKGGVLDQERAAKAILTEFRAGKLGRFNLDELI